MQIPLSRNAIYCCLNRGTIYCCSGNAYEGKRGPLLRQRVKGSSSHLSVWLPSLDFGSGVFTLKGWVVQSLIPFLWSPAEAFVLSWICNQSHNHLSYPWVKMLRGTLTAHVNWHRWWTIRKHHSIYYNQTIDLRLPSLYCCWVAGKQPDSCCIHKHSALCSPLPSALPGNFSPCRLYGCI